MSIDSSGKSAAAALTEDGRLLAEGFENNGLTHSQTLLPLIDDVLCRAETDITKVQAFALTIGPGSFTGLRIGCGTIMGLAMDRPCYPVSSLEALAYNLHGQSLIAVPLFDARREQVYTAPFRVQGDKITRLGEDSAMSAADAVQMVCQYADNDPVCLLGDGAYLLQECTVRQNISIAPPDNLLIRGFSIALAAQNVSPIVKEYIKLSYLRPSQAERNLHKSITERM